MLDFAMMIALYCQECNLIRRIVSPGLNVDRPLHPDEEDAMKKLDYNWEHFEGSRDVKDILNRINELKTESQEGNDIDVKLSQKARKGLPVFPYGQLMQY